MSGEDDEPPGNGGDDTGHDGQGQPEGGQPQGGQPQGGQQPPQGGQQPPQGGGQQPPQGGQQPPQGGQQPPQGGQQPPQGGQQPPQGGQQPPQGGQYGGQPQGQYGGGQSTMDQVTGMLSEEVTDYLLLTVSLAFAVAFGAGLAEGISSFLDGGGGGSAAAIAVGGSGPLLLSSVTGGFATAVGEVAIFLTVVAAGNILLVKTVDEDATELATSAGVLSFAGSFVFAFGVSMTVILVKVSNNFILPSIADAFIGSFLVALSGLIVGAATVFIVKNFDPNEELEMGGPQPAAPGGQQPPQGGQQPPQGGQGGQQGGQGGQGPR